MRRCLGFYFAISAVLLSVQPQFAQGQGANPALLKAKVQNVPEIPYEAVPSFLKLPPKGEAVGVATNSRGNIFVYTRTGNSYVTIGTSRAFANGGARLFEFDPSGKFVREIGQGPYGFVFAHTVRVDPQDNIWVVDEGSNMIIRVPNPEGRVVMTRQEGGRTSDSSGPNPQRHPPPPDAEESRRTQLRSERALRPTFSIDRLTWLGTRPEISSYPMAMATRGSRSSTRTACSSNPGVQEGRGRGNSTRRTRSLQTPKAMFTWAFGATNAFRFSTMTDSSQSST